MKTSPTSAIVPLSKDLENVLAIIKTKTCKTAEALCNDAPLHEKAVFENGEAVLDITFDELLSWFDNTYFHTFPQPQQLIRLGRYGEIPLYDICALVLKALFEEQLGNGMMSFVEYQAQDINFVLNYAENYFNPDFDRIYELLKKNLCFYKISKNHLTATLKRFQSTKAYLYEYTCFTANYAQDISDETDTVDDNKKYEETFYSLNDSYTNLINRLEALFEEILSIKLINVNLNDKYIKKFNKLLFELKTVTYKVELVNMKISYKEADRSLSEEQLEKMAENAMEEFEKELKELSIEIARTSRTVPNFIAMGGCFTQSLSQEMDYKNYLKKEIRALARILHPDILSEEDRSRLSREDLQDLKELFNMTMDLKKEVPFSESQVGHYLPDLAKLTYIRARAIQIYEKAGVKLDFECIPGKSLNERIAFLEKNISFLNIRLSELSLEKQNALNDKTAKQQHQILLSEKNCSEHRNLLSEAVNSTKQILAERINHLMKLFFES